MRRDPARFRGLRWRHLLLVLILLVPGTPEVIARLEAARNLRDRQALEAASSGGPVNTLTTPALMQAAPPPASGAEPPYPLNHTFDAEAHAVGDPPANANFEVVPYQTGTPPQNHDFAAGNLSGWTTAGTVSYQTEPGGNGYARLETGGALVSAAFAVSADAQFLTFRVIGLSASTDKYKAFVLSGSDFATSTQIAFATAADSWTAIRVSFTTWQGQSVKLRVERYQGTVGLDDAGLCVVEVPNWAVTGMPRRLEGGPTGAYVFTDGRLTSAPVVLAFDAQRLSLRVRRGQGITSVSSYYVELLRGPDFTTVTSLDYDVVDDTWKTSILGVAQ